MHFRLEKSGDDCVPPMSPFFEDNLFFASIPVPCLEKNNVFKGYSNDMQ